MSPVGSGHGGAAIPVRGPAERQVAATTGDTNAAAAVSGNQQQDAFGGPQRFAGWEVRRPEMGKQARSENASARPGPDPAADTGAGTDSATPSGDDLASVWQSAGANSAVKGAAAPAGRSVPDAASAEPMAQPSGTDSPGDKDGDLKSGKRKDAWKTAQNPETGVAKTDIRALGAPDLAIGESAAVATARKADNDKRRYRQLIVVAAFVLCAALTAAIVSLVAGSSSSDDRVVDARIEDTQSGTEGGTESGADEPVPAEVAEAAPSTAPATTPASATTGAATTQPSMSSESAAATTQPPVTTNPVVPADPMITINAPVTGIQQPTLVSVGQAIIIELDPTEFPDGYFLHYSGGYTLEGGFDADNQDLMTWDPTYDGASTHKLRYVAEQPGAGGILVTGADPLKPIFAVYPVVIG